MAGERVTTILKSKTDLSDEQIAAMSDGEGWQLIYSVGPRKKETEPVRLQVCFTGFSPSEKTGLAQAAVDHNLHVAKSVTQSLDFLVIGPNAGPSKMKKAKEQDTVIMNADQFNLFLRTGEIPNPETAP